MPPAKYRAWIQHRAEAQYMLANNVTDWSQWVRHHAKRFPDVSGEMLISHREMGPFSGTPAVRQCAR